MERRLAPERRDRSLRSFWSAVLVAFDRGPDTCKFELRGLRLNGREGSRVLDQYL